MQRDPTKYAKKTTVDAIKTRMEIEQTVVKRYGADQFGHAQAQDRALIQFRIKGLLVRFLLPLVGQYRDGKPHAPLTEQEVRQRWRALLLVIKAKLEAVETGIETIEHAFLAEIVLPDGKTMGEWAAPQIRTMIEGGQMPHGLPGLPDHTH
jgi:hypothetical protein